MCDAERAYTLSEVDASKVDAFATEVLQGLSRPSKTLPSRFLFDVRGSELFEKITSLPEYYPTRSETAILKARAVQLAAGVPDGGVLIEFGSGSFSSSDCAASWGIRARRPVGERACRRTPVPRRALSRPRHSADSRRLLVPFRPACRPSEAPQDRVLLRLDDRQPDARRGLAPAARLARHAVAGWSPGRRRRPQEGGRRVGARL